MKARPVLSSRLVWILFVIVCVLGWRGTHSLAVARAQQASPPPAASQQPDPQQPAQQAPTPGATVLKSEARLVRVDVVVTDKKGNYVSDLSAKDFQVFEDNKAQAV
ncbi:MAG TPA: hypothetical protein VLW83_08550, partial [Candidatus Acidoferrales bacterium]|nr:hypothetical protein [Candidatus Acidoferrales bacterium]